MSEVALQTLEFGTAVRALMRRREMSFRQLAAETDLSAGYLNHIVHGNRPVPGNDVIERLATALAVDPATFRDYRYRIVADALHDRPDLVDRLFEELGAR